jgi:hypothetical protein
MITNKQTSSKSYQSIKEQNVSCQLTNFVAVHIFTYAELQIGQNQLHTGNKADQATGSQNKACNGSQNSRLPIKTPST